MSFSKDAPIEKIFTLLDNLFRETCFHNSREEAQYQPRFSFTDHYVKLLNISKKSLENALDSLMKPKYKLAWANEDQTNLIYDQQTVIPNPVSFIFDQIIISDTYLVVVHGDLTPYNVLVDHHGEAWLIDFANAGQGHLLQDLARLETFIKLSSLVDYEPSLLLDIEKMLVLTFSVVTPFIVCYQSIDVR